MYLTTVRNRTKIRIMLMVAVAGIVLAGCGGQPAGSTAPPSQPTSFPAVGRDTACVRELTVGWADNGTVHCLQHDGRVTVAVGMPDGSVYDGDFDVSGSSLQLLPTPGGSPWRVYSGTSTGHVVISMPPQSCLADQTCPSGPPWTVAIFVQ